MKYTWVETIGTTVFETFSLLMSKCIWNHLRHNNYGYWSFMMLAAISEANSVESGICCFSAMKSWIHNGQAIDKFLKHVQRKYFCNNRFKCHEYHKFFAFFSANNSNFLARMNRNSLKKRTKNVDFAQFSVQFTLCWRPRLIFRVLWIWLHLHLDILYESDDILLSVTKLQISSICYY